MGTESTKNRFLKREGSSSSQQSLKPALVEIARLLARQAAREWSERQPEGGHGAPPHFPSEKRS